MRTSPPPIKKIRILNIACVVSVLAMLASCSSTPSNTALPEENNTTPIANSSLPTKLINGDFEYKASDLLKYSTDKLNFANVDYNKGDVNSSDDGKKQEWHHVDGFDAKQFGWKSSQTDTSINGRAPIVEIQKSIDKKNHYGEITASQANTYLYQDINTQHSSSTVYKVSLKHASRNNGDNDQLQVLVGTPGHEQPVQLTRTKSGNTQDKVGVKGTTVSSHTWGWNNNWNTYEGVVTIPANQSVTRFTFKSIKSPTNIAGNLIDDVTFQIAYPLSYQGNGAQGTLPKQTN